MVVKELHTIFRIFSLLCFCQVEKGDMIIGFINWQIKGKWSAIAVKLKKCFFLLINTCLRITVYKLFCGTENMKTNKAITAFAFLMFLLTPSRLTATGKQNQNIRQITKSTLLILQHASTVGNLDHESHMSHASHASHFSHYSSF
ncbi:MAG: hypothetical protein ABSG99_00375 [Sedimentisphaerales bacterium]